MIEGLTPALPLKDGLYEPDEDLKDYFWATFSVADNSIGFFNGTGSDPTVSEATWARMMVAIEEMVGENMEYVYGYFMAWPSGIYGLPEYPDRTWCALRVCFDYPCGYEGKGGEFWWDKDEHKYKRMK